MVFLVGWVLVLLLLAGWSALVWSGQAMLVVMLSHAGSLGAGDWSLPESLTAWLPPGVAQWLIGTLGDLTPQLQSLAGALPWLSGGVTVLAWVVWALGAVLLLGVGVAVHVAIVLWRRTRGLGMTNRTAAAVS